MSEFQAKTLVVRHTHEVQACAQDVFPLLCPVREREWLEFWACQMVYSASGVAEQDAVFVTEFPDRGRGVWICSRFEPAERIEYVVSWFTGLDEDGNRFLDEHAAIHSEPHLHVAGRVLRHYAETGQMLPIARAIAGAHG